MTDARRSAAPLPVPLDQANSLPVVAEHARLDSDLSDLVRAFDGNDRGALKQWAGKVDSLRAGFRAADRPAGAEDIARAAARLGVSVPIAGNIETGVLADAICELLAEKRVTLLELSGVVRGVTQRCRFLSGAEVGAELHRVRRRVRRQRLMLENDYAEDGRVSFPMKNYMALLVDVDDEDLEEAGE